MIEKFNTPGGHLVLLVIVMIGAGVGMFFHLPYCEDVLKGAGAVFLYVMNPQKPSA